MAPWYEKFITRMDATPDPRRSSETPALKLNYVAKPDFTRSLTVEGEMTPRYEIRRHIRFGVVPGSKCHVVSHAHGDEEIAVIDFHVTYVEVECTKRQHRIKLEAGERTFVPGSGLGSVHLKPTGGRVYGHMAWEYRDETSLIMSVEIDDRQVNGLIALWKEKLDPETVENLVLVGIAQIEEYKRLLRNAKIGVINTAVAAGTT